MATHLLDLPAKKLTKESVERDPLLRALVAERLRQQDEAKTRNS